MCQQIRRQKKTIGIGNEDWIKQVLLNDKEEEEGGKEEEENLFGNVRTKEENPITFEEYDEMFKGLKRIKLQDQMVHDMS